MNKLTKKNKLEEKIKELDAKLIQEQDKCKDYLNQLRYLQADFENFRKRVEKETKEAIQISNQKLVSAFVEIVDDFEKAISAGETTDNKDALLQGIKMVHKNFCKLLEREGLEQIQCLGKPFDPNLHEVLIQVPTNNHETGTVLEEARKGFIFKGKVLRPSVVNISCQTSKSDNK